ncbi:hypothetical protein ABZZ80_29000 [Streptomyces sp. NPDC006356]
MLDGWAPWPELLVEKHRAESHWEGRPPDRLLGDSPGRAPGRSALVDADGNRWTYAVLGLVAERLRAEGIGGK